MDYELVLSLKLIIILPSHNRVEGRVDLVTAVRVCSPHS